MKKTLQYLLLITFFTFGFGIQTSFADDNCRAVSLVNQEYSTYISGSFSDFEFNKLDEVVKPTTLNLLFNQQSPIIIESGFADFFTCMNKIVNYQIIGPNNTEVLSIPYDFAPAYSGDITYLENTINLSKLCDENHNCSFKFRVKGEGSILDSYSENATSTREGKGTFHFKCEGDQCTKNIKIRVNKPKLQVTENSEIKGCKIGKSDITFDPITSDDLDDRIATLNIDTSGCSGKLELIIWEENSGPDDKVSLVKADDSDTEILEIIPTENEVSISFKMGGGECDDTSLADCAFYVEIEKYEKDIVDTESELSDYDTWGKKWKTDKSFTEKGVILGDASKNEPWKIVSYRGMMFPEDLKDAEGVSLQKPFFDAQSPCIKDPNNPSMGYKEGCYEFLAPIAGIELDENGAADPRFTNENGRIAINDIRTYKLGDYINKLFQMAIAILGVLAVIMIIVAGVQYMTEESITGKSNAKERITGAVAGLLLSIGIFVILNTINPKLLEINFGSKLGEVEVKIDADISVSAENLNISGAADVEKSKYLVDAGIYCPKTGGSAVVKKVAESFLNKSTYRLGGKYWNIGKNNPKVRNKDGELVSAYAGKDKNKTCDIDSKTICIDCSGFTNLVLYCSGIIKTQNIGNGGTSDLFSGVSANASKKIKTFDKEKGIVNGTALVPGDLLGKTGSSFGHVGIYIGNGEVIESTSNFAGRNLNKMTHKSKISDRNSYMERVLRIKDIPQNYKK